jgi:hypothetical protein
MSEMIWSGFDDGSSEWEACSVGLFCTAVIEFASFELGSDGSKDKTSDLIWSGFDDGSAEFVCTAVTKFPSFELGSDGIKDKTSDWIWSGSTLEVEVVSSDAVASSSGMKACVIGYTSQAGRSIPIAL